MKLTPAYQIRTIMTGLAATAIGMIALQSCSQLSAISILPQQLIAQGDAPALAKQLHGKPVVVDIYASWCRGCQSIAPTLSKLKQQYGNRATFVVFDVSDRQKTAASMKTADKLGLAKFFDTNKAQTSTVAIINPVSGKVTKQFQYNSNLADYTSVLDLEITQMEKGNAIGYHDAIQKP